MRELDGAERSFDLPLPEGLALSDEAEVALEDYARERTGSREAQALRAAARDAPVTALRLRGLADEPSETARQDVAAFARELALRRSVFG
jgi:hypothetical protein